MQPPASLDSNLRSRRSARDYSKDDRVSFLRAGVAHRDSIAKCYCGESDLGRAQSHSLFRGGISIENACLGVALPGAIRDKPEVVHRLVLRDKNLWIYKTGESLVFQQGFFFSPFP